MLPNEEHHIKRIIRGTIAVEKQPNNFNATDDSQLLPRT